MLSAVAIIPSAPVLVPQLAGAASSEVADLRAAVAAAAAVLPARWVAVGTGSADETLEPNGVTGTFAGFGVDVRVRLSPQTAEGGCGQVPAEFPVSALIAAWVRGQVRPEASAQVRVYRSDRDAGSAHALGRELRAELESSPEPIGVLIVADGANTLSPSAPGGYHPGAAEQEKALDDALADGDASALARLPDQILGRVAFQVLAGLTEPGPRLAKELYRGAPFGVGYFAGVWQL